MEGHVRHDVANQEDSHDEGHRANYEERGVRLGLIGHFFIFIFVSGYNLIFSLYTLSRDR